MSRAATLSRNANIIVIARCRMTGLVVGLVPQLRASVNAELTTKNLRSSYSSIFGASSPSSMLLLVRDAVMMFTRVDGPSIFTVLMMDEEDGWGEDLVDGGVDVFLPVRKPVADDSDDECNEQKPLLACTIGKGDRFVDPFGWEPSGSATSSSSSETLGNALSAAKPSHDYDETCFCRECVLHTIEGGARGASSEVVDDHRRILDLCSLAEREEALKPASVKLAEKQSGPVAWGTDQPKAVREASCQSNTHLAAEVAAEVASKAKAAAQSTDSTSGTKSQKKPAPRDKTKPTDLRFSKDEFMRLPAAQRKAWTSVKGSARTAMYEDLTKYLANLDAPKDSGAEEKEEEPSKPKARNVPPDPFGTDALVLPPGGNTYELAYPDALPGKHLLVVLVVLAYYVAVSFLSYTGAVHVGACLLHAAAIVICMYRMDDEFRAISFGGVDRGAFRSLLPRTQFAHLILLSVSLLRLCLVFLEVVWALGAFIILAGADVWTLPRVLSLAGVVVNIVVGSLLLWLTFDVLKNEVASVTRIVLHVMPPTDPGQLRGVRENDPNHADYVVDNRPQNMQGSDLTVPVLSRGTASFAVAIARQEGVWVAALWVHRVLARVFGMWCTDVELQYSMAMLQEYMTLGNSCVGLDYPVRLQKMLLYKNNFHKVLYPRTENTRIQNTANNTAILAAFISETQNAILKSAALNWVRPIVQ